MTDSTFSQPMALGQVPLILQQLVDRQRITKPQQAEIVEAIASGAEKGFAGQIAVRRGFLTQAQLDAELEAQSIAKIGAALSDLAAVKAGATLEAPSFLKANWGNHGVNPKSSPGAASGLSAVANLLQNLALLVKEEPRLAAHPDIEVADAVGRRLHSALTPDAEDKYKLPADTGALVEVLAEGLRQAALARSVSIGASKGEQIPNVTADALGKPVHLETFLNNRLGEAKEGLRLLSGQERSWAERMAGGATGRELG